MGCCESSNNKKNLNNNLNNRNQFDQNLNTPKISSLQNEFPVEVNKRNELNDNLSNHSNDYKRLSSIIINKGNDFNDNFYNNQDPAFQNEYPINTNQNYKFNDFGYDNYGNQNTNYNNEYQQIRMNERDRFINSFWNKNIEPSYDPEMRNGIFIKTIKKKMAISENSINIEAEIIVSVCVSNPNSYYDKYSIIIDSKVSELKSIEVYVDDIKIDDYNLSIRDFCVDFNLGKTFNGQSRKVKVIQEIQKQLVNYSLQPLMLNEENVFAQFIIYGEGNIQIDDISNRNYRLDQELNLAYFEGKTTRQTANQHGFINYSRRINYQIYNYIQEYRDVENQIISNKSNTNEMKIIFLAIYKKITFTEYGQDIDELYKIKVVNYGEGTSLKTYSLGLLQDIRFDVDLVELNGKPANYSKDYSSININNFGALNNQFGEIHIKYKYYTNLDKSLLRKESIITTNTKGTYCKIIANIPDNYVVLSSKDIFQKSPENNNMYLYNGISNEEELKEYFQFCFKKGTWDIYQEFTLSSLSNIEQCKFIMNRLHKGGNLKEYQYDIHKGNGEFIDDQINDKFIFSFNNPMTNKINIGFRIKVENSTSDYKFIEKSDLITQIPEADKPFFKNLSDMIINNDKSKNPVYKKLGKWVHDYLKYNINLKGKILTAKDIYNIRSGVCEHYTLLYNTLLVSQGIEAIQVSGYALDITEDNIIKENEFTKQIINEPNSMKSLRHAWTLAKVDGEWIPIDATWNMFEKNVPITHIFQHYGKGSFLSSYIGNPVESKNTNEIISYIKNSN